MPTLHRLILQNTPVGPLTLVASASGLAALRFGRPAGPRPGETSLAEGADHPVLNEAVLAMEEYFRGDLDVLAGLPLDPGEGTPFRRRVWAALRRIPGGTVTTYGSLARELAQGSPRAVGQAVGANPLPVVIPCHRVVAGDGRLGGFSGGLERKVALLELEGIRCADARFDARIRKPADAPELGLPLGI